MSSGCSLIPLKQVSMEHKTVLELLNKIGREGELNRDRYFISQSLQVIRKKALVVAKQQVSTEDKAPKGKSRLRLNTGVRVGKVGVKGL